jgi:hypothetical protein
MMRVRTVPSNRLPDAFAVEQLLNSWKECDEPTVGALLKQRKISCKFVFHLPPEIVEALGLDMVAMSLYGQILLNRDEQERLKCNLSEMPECETAAKGSRTV